MSKVQTDNSFLSDKVMLRLNNLPDKNEINVLDTYAGEGIVWNNVKKLSDKKINIVSIDTKEFKRAFLKGDNVRFLKSINLSEFDVIDLDAFGVPYNQLKSIFGRVSECVVFLTFIQSFYGGLPLGLLSDIGYNKTMIRKIPTLFFKKGLKKMKLFLALNGVRKIKIRSYNNKHYIAFNL